MMSYVVTNRYSWSTIYHVKRLQKKRHIESNNRGFGNHLNCHGGDPKLEDLLCSPNMVHIHFDTKVKNMSIATHPLDDFQGPLVLSWSQLLVCVDLSRCAC